MRVKLSKRKLHEIWRKRSHQNLRMRARGLSWNGLQMAAFALTLDSVKGEGLAVKRNPFDCPFKL